MEKNFNFIGVNEYEAIRQFVESKKSELSSLKGDNYFHDENVYEHTLAVEEYIIKVFGENDFFMRSIALIHDLGKMHTGKPSRNGGMSYPGHENKTSIRSDFDFLNLHEWQYHIIQRFVNYHHVGMHVHKIPPYMQISFWQGLSKDCEFNKLFNPRALILFALCDLKGAVRSNPRAIEEANKLITQIERNYIATKAYSI